MQYPNHIAAVAKAATAGAKDTALPQQQILAGLKKQGNKQRDYAVVQWLRIVKGGRGQIFASNALPPPPPPPPGPRGRS